MGSQNKRRQKRNRRAQRRASDGQANLVTPENNVLNKTAEQKAESGVTATTLGFGTHFNEDLLIGMARAAGGNFYFIQSADDAADVFTFELQTMKAVAAQNLTLTPPPAHRGRA